jgi:hypothetical protein
MPQFGVALRNGIQAIEMTSSILGSGGEPDAKTGFRSINAAEMVQHRLQQMIPRPRSGIGLGHRKFHCVFKDSRAR